MKFNFEKIQSRIQITFKNQNLLIEALTHKSFCIEENKGKPHNERLEFLGDSVLNFIIASYLVSHFPKNSEGVLSKKRAGLVNQTILFEVANSLNISEFILFGPGEINQGSHNNPRILASTVEAIIGALYLDSDFATCEKWVLKQFSEVLESQADHEEQQYDSKTKLQELTQKFKMGTPTYEVVLTTGPSHKPQFLVSLKLNDVEKARAEGASKKAAEQRAAEMYLLELNKEIK